LLQGGFHGKCALRFWRVQKLGQNKTTQEQSLGDHHSSFRKLLFANISQPWGSHGKLRKPELEDGIASGAVKDRWLPERARSSEIKDEESVIVRRKRSFSQAFFCFQFKSAVTPREHSSRFHAALVIDADERSSASLKATCSGPPKSA
jgi:hypothetical protein